MRGSVLIYFFSMLVCTLMWSCGAPEVTSEKPPTQQDLANIEESVKSRYKKIGECNRAIDSLIVFNAGTLDNKILSAHVGETISNIRKQIAAIEKEISGFKASQSDIKNRLGNKAEKDSTAAELKNQHLQ